MDQIFNEPEAVRQPLRLQSSQAATSNLQPKAVRQPLRLQSSLAAISNPQLPKEKTDLLKDTVFHALSTVSSKSQSSGTLINVLIDSYDVQAKSFKFEQASLKFCAKEVASVLNMEMKGEGKTIDINLLQPHEFENWVLEWRDIGLDGGKLNSNVVLSPRELKKILLNMKVNEDETNNMRCKKLLLYFLLDQFLFSTSSSTPRSCIWQLVEDLDQIESYNWPQSILDWTHSELARVKNSGGQPGHAKSKNRTFGSPSPVLEAMLYERIPIIQPPLNGGPLNIQKFKGVKKSVEEWLAVLSRLKQSDEVRELRSFTLQELLGNTDMWSELENKNGLLYFDSPRCDFDRGHLYSILKRDYDKIKAKYGDSEVVFVSLLPGLGFENSRVSEMKWLILPLGMCESVSIRISPTSMPSVVAFGPDGKILSRSAQLRLPVSTSSASLFDDTLVSEVALQLNWELI